MTSETACANRTIVAYPNGVSGGGGLYPTDWNAGTCCGAAGRTTGGAGNSPALGEMPRFGAERSAVVARELTITGLRLLAASKGVVLSAERFGKHKTISQIVAIIALLVIDAKNDWPAWAQNLFQGWSVPFTEVALWLTVALTAASGLIYLWRNREIYLSDV